MNSTEYSLNVVTPEAGVEINGQTKRNDEIEYSIQVVAAEGQPPRYDNYDHQRRIRRVTVSPSVYRRALTTRGTYDSSTYATVSHATYERTETNYSPENENNTTNGAVSTNLSNEI